MHDDASAEQLQLAADLGMSFMEDMRRACSESEYDFDRAEWGFEVRSSYGFPRTRIGILVIRIHDSGKVGVYIE